jgi:hypothetical protein
MYSDISTASCKVFYVKTYKFKNAILYKVQMYYLLKIQFG